MSFLINFKKRKTKLLDLIAFRKSLFSKLFLLLIIKIND